MVFVMDLLLALFKEVTGQLDFILMNDDSVYFFNLSFIVLTAIYYTIYVQHGHHRNIHCLVYLSLFSFQNTTFIMCPTA